MASVEAVHVQVGVVLFVGEVVEGVPGVVGAVVSTVNVAVAALPLVVVLLLLSVARTYMVWLPSESAVPGVQVKFSVAELKLPSLAVQAVQLPEVASI